MAGAAGSVTATSSSSLIYHVPAGGGLIGGGRAFDIGGSGTGVPVTRQLTTPQTTTFYAGFLMKVWGNPNTEDIYTIAFNNSPSDTANGFNCGIRGVVSGNQTYYFIRKGTGTPPPGMLASLSGSITSTRYLVLKVEKTGAGNFNKVTGWVNPGTNAEVILPNGDLQLLTDLGIGSIFQVNVRASGVDSGDKCTIDALTLTKTFAGLMSLRARSGQRAAGAVDSSGGGAQWQRERAGVRAGSRTGPIHHQLRHCARGQRKLPLEHARRVAIDRAKRRRVGPRSGGVGGWSERGLYRQRRGLGANPGGGQCDGAPTLRLPQRDAAHECLCATLHLDAHVGAGCDSRAHPQLRLGGGAVSVAAKPGRRGGGQSSGGPQRLPAATALEHEHRCAEVHPDDHDRE